jgi:hypothetical protein
MRECTAQPTSRHVHFSQDPMESHLSAALLLAQQSFSLLPLHSISSDGTCTCNREDCDRPGKHPRTLNGSKDATRDKVTIQAWWKQYPRANIGIATGIAANLIVLDVDLKSGGLESLQKLEAQHGSLEAHRQVTSGGGGKHFYFQAAEIPIKNCVGFLPGLDIRGKGGYIVAPPSLHASGKRYAWGNELSIQQMPAWLIALISLPASCPKTEESTHIPEGKRNSTLLSIAGFLKAKGLCQATIQQLLPHINQLACNPPLPEAEVCSLAAGMARYESWGPVIPLPTSVTQVIPMTPEYLPSPLRAWVVDICERMQLPLEYVAAPALVALSTVIGRKVAIQPLCHDDWIVIPNLWGMLVAEPGSMKSPALKQALAPLATLEKKARAAYETACQEYAKKEKDIALEVECLKQSLKLDWSMGMGQNIKEKKDHLQRLTQQDGTALKEKRHKTNDPTIEKLVMILKDNPQGILLHRDELSGWLESLSKSGREGSREFYLEAWNGDGSFSMDRIGRGSTFTDSICLSIFGGIQPQKLQHYMDRYENTQGQDGFLERFQVAVYPDPIRNWKLIDRKPDQTALKQVMDLFETLDVIPMTEASPQTVAFSYDAQILANEWRAKLEKKVLDQEISIGRRSYLSKYRSLMPSLALIFEVVHVRGIPLDISKEATVIAIQWADLLETHMHKILCMGQTPEKNSQLLLQKMKHGELYDGIKIREIHRHQWKGMREVAQVREALQTLERHGYIRIKKEAGLGGTTESILINPNFGGAL